jgi:hypothetical protein
MDLKHKPFFMNVRFEVFTAVTMKNGVFLVVKPWGSFGISSPIFVTLMKEAPDSSETSALTRATQLNNPEDTIQNRGILRSHLRVCDLMRNHL